MRPLSQVDPWNGCKVCRRQAELGIMPCHNWTHELRMWWDGRVPAWTRGSEPGREIPEPEPSAVGTTGTVVGIVGDALAPLADRLRKGSEGEFRLGSLSSYYYAGRLAALLAEKYHPSTTKEASVCDR